MHPWTKAYRDVYSEDDLEALYSIEQELKQINFEKIILENVDEKIQSMPFELAYKAYKNMYGFDLKRAEILLINGRGI